MQVVPNWLTVSVLHELSKPLDWLDLQSKWTDTFNRFNTSGIKAVIYTLCTYICIIDIGEPTVTVVVFDNDFQWVGCSTCVCSILYKYNNIVLVSPNNIGDYKI